MTALFGTCKVYKSQIAKMMESYEPNLSGNSINYFCNFPV